MIKENEIIKVIDDGQVEYIQFKKLLNYKNINHAYILKTHDMNFRVGKDFRHIESVKEKLKTVCLSEQEWKKYTEEYKKDKTRFTYKEEPTVEIKTKSLKEKAKELFED